MNIPRIECFTQMPKCSHEITFIDGIKLKPGAVIRVVRAEGDRIMFEVRTGTEDGDPVYGVYVDYSKAMTELRERGLYDQASQVI